MICFVASLFYYTFSVDKTLLFAVALDPRAFEDPSASTLPPFHTHTHYITHNGIHLDFCNPSHSRKEQHES